MPCIFLFVSVLTASVAPLQAQQTVSGPPSTSSEPPKPTFPAYTQPSATTSPAGPASSTVAKPPATVSSKPATLSTGSATSKLMHPDEDISLVSARAAFVIIFFFDSK